MTIEREPYGTLADGRRVTRFTVSNASGTSVSMIDFGCTLTRVDVPDRDGKAVNVILSFDGFEGYQDRPMFCGAVVGRFANRIEAGKFTLDGREYRLACNSNGHHLHGGVNGFDKVLWKARAFRGKNAAGVRFDYVSRDGEEGYPGTVKATVVYSLTDDSELSLEYRATTDKPTPVNLTNHAYWNLTGEGLVEDHVLSSPGRFYLPVNPALIPTGEVVAVKGTPLDFTTAKPIGRHIGKVEGGYDHCLIVDRKDECLALACRAADPRSGRSMEVWTTLPAFQFYSGNFLDGRKGAGGRVFERHAAFCIEPEFFPNCVNVPHFPSCILRPGSVWHHLTVHRFSRA
ncbi:MAG: galactose mutarotase [Spirochaetes bacterium]|nr:galactose mutarotase [Spirochaetota bacterium]